MYQDDATGEFVNAFSKAIPTVDAWVESTSQLTLEITINVFQKMKEMNTHLFHPHSSKLSPSLVQAVDTASRRLGDCFGQWVYIHKPMIK